MDGPPTLMTLPAEMRNTIYDYALIEPTRVDITAQLKQPSLLMFSRTVRSEAKQLWYASNEFDINVHDYNPSLLINLHRHVHDTLPPGLLLRIRCSFSGGPHWAKVTAWCSAACSNEGCFFPKFESRMSKNDGFAVASVEMALSISSMTKEKREEAWSVWRKAAGLVDSQWLEDKS